MPAVLDCFCQVLYGITLAISALWSTGLAKLISLLGCLPRSVREGCANVLVQTAFRLTRFFTPWVWCTADDKSAAALSMAQAKMKEVDARTALGESPKPLVVLGNHTSFFDTLLGTMFLPSSFAWRSRMYVSSALLKMPVIHTMIRTQGHFLVPFASGEGPQFTVDKDKLAEVERHAAEHVSAGGWVIMFPEGTVNPDPDTLLPFRYGGMKNVLEWDARVVMFVGHGSSRVWPKQAKIGGLPGRVRCSARFLAPDGVRAYVADLRASPDLPAEDSGLADHELLAKHLRLAMQAQYDELRGAAAAAGPCCCPCGAAQADTGTGSDDPLISSSA